MDKNTEYVKERAALIIEICNTLQFRAGKDGFLINAISSIAKSITHDKNSKEKEANDANA